MPVTSFSSCIYGEQFLLVLAPSCDSGDQASSEACEGLFRVCLTDIFPFVIALMHLLGQIKCSLCTLNAGTLLN